MLNVGKIEEGFVLDHIQAGMAMSIYHHLQLDKLDCTVAIIKNAAQRQDGKKDILKVECDVNMLDLDVLGLSTITSPSMSSKAGISSKRRN